MNEQIRISPVRVIGPNSEQIGVIPTHEALRMAQDQGLDLVEVQPNVRPPVCRVMDYGKFKYHQKKTQRKHHEQQLKEVRLRPKTDTHDLEIKTKRAAQFLEEGDKVQFTVVFKGRERAHREIGADMCNKIVLQLGELAKVERPPLMDGRSMVMILAPGKAVQDKSAAAAKASQQSEVGKAARQDGAPARAASAPAASKPAAAAVPAPASADASESTAPGSAVAPATTESSPKSSIVA
ncbi:MAG: translation initiation factor IF-3 [Phycisphaerae bacterium]